MFHQKRNLKIVIECVLVLFIVPVNHVSSQDYFVSNLKQNELWIGISNPLVISVNNISCDSLFISTDNGRIQTIQDSINSNCNRLFMVVPALPGKVTITIEKIIDKDTLFVGKSVFRALYITNLLGFINNLSTGEISKSDLLDQTGIQVVLDRSKCPIDIDIQHLVTEFSILIIKQNSCQFIGDFKGYKFTKEIKTLFSELETGDKLLFFNIKALGPEGIAKQVVPLELKIKK